MSPRDSARSHEVSSCIIIAAHGWAEGCETWAEVVLERLGELIEVVQGLDGHVTKTTADGTGRRDGDGSDCVALMIESKERCDSADPLVRTPWVSVM